MLSVFESHSTFIYHMEILLMQTIAYQVTAIEKCKIFSILDTRADCEACDVWTFSCNKRSSTISRLALNCETCLTMKFWCERELWSAQVLISFVQSESESDQRRWQQDQKAIHMQVLQSILEVSYLYHKCIYQDQEDVQKVITSLSTPELIHCG